MLTQGYSRDSWLQFSHLTGVYTLMLHSKDWIESEGMFLDNQRWSSPTKESFERPPFYKEDSHNPNVKSAIMYFTAFDCQKMMHIWGGNPATTTCRSLSPKWTCTCSSIHFAQGQQHRRVWSGDVFLCGQGDPGGGHHSWPQAWRREHRGHRGEQGGVHQVPAPGHALISSACDVPSRLFVSGFIGM